MIFISKSLPLSSERGLQDGGGSSSPAGRALSSVFVLHDFEENQLKSQSREGERS